MAVGDAWFTEENRSMNLLFLCFMGGKESRENIVDDITFYSPCDTREKGNKEAEAKAVGSVPWLVPEPGTGEGWRAEKLSAVVTDKGKGDEDRR
ncbi:hypothetical protein LXL04_030015 [Taraxacum kok-saghyz]